MKKTILFAACAAALALAGCTDTNGAVAAAEDAGYTNVQTTGWDFAACSEGDFSSTGFTATGPTGRPVRGTVCGGLFKGQTIRLKR